MTKQAPGQTDEFCVPLSAVLTPTLVLDREFVMIAANPSRLEVTGTTLAAIIGRNLFDVFPDNPGDPATDGVRNLRASLERVLRDKVPDTMAVQKYDIPLPGSDPIAFEQRYWSPKNIPILDKQGEVTHILHQVTDVTATVRSQGQQDEMSIEIYLRSEEVRMANLELKLAKEDLERKIIERAAQLQASEARLQHATVSAAIGVWEVDVATGRMWRSASHDRLFGYAESSEMWTLDTFLNHVHPEDRPSVAAEFSLGKDVWNSEYRVVRTDASVRWMATRGAVHRAKNGNVLGVSGVSFDITARKSAEVQTAIDKQKFEAVFLESPAAVALLRGPELVFEKVNRRYHRMVGSRDLIGRSFEEAFPELHNQPFAGLLKTVYETGEPFIANEMRAHVVRKEGGQPEESYWDFAYIRLLDGRGKPYGVCNHAHDVTDRVLFRIQLQEAQGQLIQAKEAAEAASRMKSAFLANMSHEMRTPLGAVMGLTDLLKDPELDSTERRQFLDTISTTGRALTRLIDDILDLAKVEAGRLDIETMDFSLYDLITDVFDLFQEKARTKGLFFHFDIAAGAPALICTDPTRIRQILVNVIGNAVKFTDEGGVRVHVGYETRGDADLQFTVDIIDTGIGLTDDQKARLFQPFAQADNTTTRRYGGTGLGLALSKRLAEALGGSIGISQYALGRGCTFTVTFVAQKADANKASVVADRTAGDLTGIHVLAVDDSPENLFLVQRYLVKGGATVETAVNGEEAVEKAVQGDYDIVLMDIQMPKMDGFESKKVLDERGYIIPVVALTAHAMQDDRAKTRAAGFSAHLTKPLSRPELIQTVARLARRCQTSHPSPSSLTGAVGMQIKAVPNQS